MIFFTQQTLTHKTKTIENCYKLEVYRFGIETSSITPAEQYKPQKKIFPYEVSHASKHKTTLYITQFEHTISQNTLHTYVADEKLVVTYTSKNIFGEMW